MSSPQSPVAILSERLRSRLVPMSGREPDDPHRAVTPLELIFDLVFVIAFAQASSEFAHLTAEGDVMEGVIGFSFAMFAVIWAWINFSWFASAFDTDDWLYRIVTMVQMVGVLVLASGLHDMFASIREGGVFELRVMVFGYVIMRLAMVFQWLRAGRNNPAYRRACLAYSAAVTIAQIGWIALIIIDTSLRTALVASVVLIGVEIAGPWLAERLCPTPWHAGHIAERYGLLTIIALGEGIVGTFAAVQSVIERGGWSWEVGAVGFAGVTITFGLWWIYFLAPFGIILRQGRNKAFPWGYGHIPLFASIAATGAGLHVSALYIEHEAHIGALATVLSVVVPVALFLVMLYLMYAYVFEQADGFHLWLFCGNIAVLAVSVFLAGLGVSVPVCLLVIMLAPMVTVAGYELLGHRHQVAMLRDLGIPAET